MGRSSPEGSYTLPRRRAMEGGMRGERRWSGLVVLALALCLVAGGCTGGARHPARARGTATPTGRLAAPVHDAAGALLGGTPYVFGGGAQQTVTAVQAVVPGRRALLKGRLPAPRSDLAAITVAGRAYLVGGYDGRAPSRAVLQTTDGMHFRTVAQLPQGVRYPALAADGVVVYVFGGEPAPNVESRAIQAIDLRTGTARVVGRLPQGLADAAAVRLGGRIYLAGGRSGGRATDAIWRFDPASRKMIHAGRLPRPVSNAAAVDRKSTRLNSSHPSISYAVFC